MAEALHLSALAFSAAGTCCLVVDRRRARTLEVIAALLMLLAMLDLARGRPLLAPVVWAAVLIATAMVLAAVRGTQVRAAARVPVGARGSDAAGAPVPAAALPGEALPAAALPGAAMTWHTALGMVVMSVLVLAMSAHGGSPGAVPADGMGGMHPHAGAGVLLVLFVVGYALASFVATVRGHARRDRIQYFAMGCSTLIMALAVMIPRL